MVEVHDHPELARSDGAQALTPSQYAQLIREVHAIRQLTAPVNQDGETTSKNA
jgi:3-deoxy-7-phosphoheptulonate synthase